MAVLLKFIGLAVIHLLINRVMAANMIVGGANGGWDLSTNLQSWASSKTFSPGDTLTFSFGPVHSVVEVSKADYEACIINAPIQAYTGGKAVVKLSSQGKRYFICGTPGHCSQGMKMEISIASASEIIKPPTASPIIATPELSSPPPVKGPIIPTPKLSSPPPVEGPIIPTPELSSPPPVKGLAMAPSSIPAHAPMMPSAALSPVIQTLGPPVMQSSEAAGPSPQVVQGKNSGGRQVEGGILLVVSLLMCLV